MAPADGGYLSSILRRARYGRRDQKAKNPDRTLVGVASLRGLVHGAFRIAADGCQLRSQMAVDDLCP